MFVDVTDATMVRMIAKEVWDLHSHCFPWIVQPDVNVIARLVS